MRVLVACEYSGTVRRAFASKGHEAWSCDLLPADDGSPNHIMGDVGHLINGPGGPDLGPDGRASAVHVHDERGCVLAS